MSKEMWDCLEETYLQATKDKEFQLKQQLQNIRLGSRSTNDYLKEFKGICDGLAAIHKPVDEDSKVINFARGLGPKYRTFRTVMLGKPPYITLNQLINALRGFDIREDDEDTQLNHNMAFQAQRFYRGRGGSNQRRGSFSSRGRGFRPAVGQNNQITQGMNAQKGKEISSPYQICGRNNHTSLKCFYRWDFSYQASDDLPQALVVVNLQDTKNEDNTMYVDSGASTHMINSPGM
uniref:Retrotransposon gag domain-containing protein n=1 Tax=Nicotiana tabacum TaxID=4097 RepID=A0A1S4BU00_TOBAC|nr:PREDICTED: uncharacterized protein LOC107811814 [Nicotiana tabacum]